MEKFTYFHCYTEELWEGYEKNGLLRENFGIRFMSHIRLPKELTFNELAKKGGKLYNYIKEHKCPLYVDRLQGGISIQSYEYDTDLVEEYKKLLGDNFLGFQMHEWLSNYMQDVHKLWEIPEEEWNKENIERRLREKYTTQFLYLESMPLEEFAAYGKPKDIKSLYNNMTRYYKDRAKKLPLVPCSSLCFTYPFEAQAGAKIIMPEIGAQVPGMRIQLSFARGVCKAYGITLGAYYEPWGGDVGTTCTYHKEHKNEWRFHHSSRAIVGENGGSSRSLHWRVHLYAYLSGAKMISEEWGGYNTFKDAENYELSEYGLVKKRFLDFVDKYPNIGEKLAPIAAVVSNDLLSLTTYWDIEKDARKLFGYELEGEEFEARRSLLLAVDKIFGCNVLMTGSETRSLVNSTVPDAVDMLNESDGKPLQNYRYLINLTGDSSFEERYNNCISPEEVTEKLEQLLPCKVTGGLHYLVNRRGEDGYYLTIFNHSGVIRTVSDGDTVLYDTQKTAVVQLKDNRTLKPLEGSKNVSFKDGKYYVTLTGGDYFFAEF